MNPYLLPLLFVGVAFLVIVVLNERINLFRSDRFTPAGKYVAYLWLGFFMMLLGFIVTFSARNQPTMEQLRKLPFYALFELHALLIIFLLGWWLLSGRPPLGEFLNIRREQPGKAIMTGLSVGVGGWIFTIIMALLIAAILTATGLIPKPAAPPIEIVWLAAMPAWKKVTLVIAAMTIEEAFFRGWLQKRVGLLASTLFFALAHSGYGQPLLLIGVGTISLVIGFTFYRTKNLIPGIVAHGVFDAIQFFVILPVALKLTGMGS